jgi:hypothetical protein
MALTADSQGRVTGRFTIPANIPAGTKLVEFAGNGGTKGAASFTGRGRITINELRAVQNQTTVTTRTLERYDPLAETFTPNGAILASAVDVWVMAKGSTGNTLVELRECENGVPTARVVVAAVKRTSTLTVGGWNRFSWPPVRLEAGREYAVVVGCDDAVTAVAVAELSKYDSSANKWVTSQPYTVGVLLSSSNGSTWTPHQDKDLTFRLIHTPMASTSTVVTLPDIAVTNADELMVLAAVERPTEACDVVFQITLPDASQVTVTEGERVLLPSTMTGTIKWNAMLTGSADATPRLHKDVQMAWGTRATSGQYVTPRLTAGSGSKVSVYFDGFVPSGSSLLIEVAETAAGPWTTVPFVSAQDLGDGWADYTYRLPTWNPATATVRFTLTGHARARPMIRPPRVAIT